MKYSYSLRQQKIYSDYNNKSTENLIEMINSQKYTEGIIEVLKDILTERKVDKSQYEVEENGSSGQSMENRESVIKLSKDELSEKIKKYDSRTSEIALTLIGAVLISIWQFRDNIGTAVIFCIVLVVIFLLLLLHRNTESAALKKHLQFLTEKDQLSKTSMEDAQVHSPDLETPISQADVTELTNTSNKQVEKQELVSSIKAGKKIGFSELTEGMKIFFSDANKQLVVGEIVEVYTNEKDKDAIVGCTVISNDDTPYAIYEAEGAEIYKVNDTSYKVPISKPIENKAHQDAEGSVQIPSKMAYSNVTKKTSSTTNVEIPENRNSKDPEYFCFICSTNGSLVSSFYDNFRSAGLDLQMAKYLVTTQVVRAKLRSQNASVQPFKGNRFLASQEESINTFDDFFDRITEKGDLLHIFYVAAKEELFLRVRTVYLSMLSQAAKQGILPFPMYVTGNSEAKDYLIKSFK
jgi:hypothetical protein